MKLFHLVAAVGALILAGCAATPLATDGTATVAEDEGLLAVRFVSNWKGNESAWFEAMEFIASRDGRSVTDVMKMRSNNDAQLIALPAGNYTWSKTHIGGNSLSLNSDYGFTIRPGETTYIGDVTLFVTLKTFSLTADVLTVKNNEAATIAQLRQDYGELIDKYPVRVEITTMLPD